MAIEYRNIQPTEVEDAVLSSQALEAERAAFQAEMEVKRLTNLESLAGDSVLKAELQKLVDDATSNATVLRNKATRKNDGGYLQQAAVDDSRREFLNNWITSLEQEHVAHTILMQQREAALASTNADSPTDEEKVGIEQRLQENKDALAVIESSWDTATTELDSLGGST